MDRSNPYRQSNANQQPLQIHIIGLGVSEHARLAQAAEQALQRADRILGSERQLAVIRHLGFAEHHGLLPPLRELADQIDHWQASGLQQIVVLASGDPLFYGIGRWFGQHFDRAQLHFYPAISSIQAACHQLGLSLQDVQTVSLHGRPLASLRRHLQPGKTLVILTDQHSQPSALARECLRAGLAQSRLWVCENLGYANAKVREYAVAELLQSSPVFSPLHVTVIDLQGGGMRLQGEGSIPAESLIEAMQAKTGAVIQPRFPGIPDHHFITHADQPECLDGKGMLTKREVRLAILSLLQVDTGDCVWDIGAGCGGVAVELAYWHPLSQVIAIERHSERLTCLSMNRERFGVVNNLQIVAGQAPTVLQQLAPASKIFVGGSDGNCLGLLTQLWQVLPEAGVLVISAVTEQTRHDCLSFLQARNQCGDALIETLQIAVSRGGELAGHLTYRPALPVTLFAFVRHTQLAGEDSGAVALQRT